MGRMPRGTPLQTFERKTMKYEQFKKKYKGENIYSDFSYSSWSSSRNATVISECGHVLKWRIGGVGGGSCWDTGDTDPHYAISGEPEPEFHLLDEILEEACPQISFIQYKRICSQVIKTNEYTENEYYGNYTDYAVKWFDLRELYDALVERDLLCDD